MGWRYFAQRLPSGDFVGELPLKGVQVTESLSGPMSISATLPVEMASLKGDAMLKEWGSAIFVEADGVVRGWGIVDRISADGPSLSLECIGFSGYLKDLPYVGNGEVWTKVDPLHVVRKVWEHAQSFPDGDLGVIVDDVVTPVRIGEEPYIPISQQPSSDTTFNEGPIRLNWWDVHDLGAFVDDLAEQTPFDYREETSWNADHTGLVHRLRLGYPTIGARRDDLRFVVGENIATPPGEVLAEAGYASEVMFLGAGEGREKIRAAAGGRSGRLRRVAVVVDDSVKRISEAQVLARREHARRQGFREIREVAVRDHPNAPIGSFSAGDEIRVQGDIGWAEADTWGRIVACTFSPENGDIVTLTLAQSEGV